MMDWILANLVVLFFVFLKKLKGESEEIERSSISESAEGTFLYKDKDKLHPFSLINVRGVRLTQNIMTLKFPYFKCLMKLRLNSWKIILTYKEP